MYAIFAVATAIVAMLAGGCGGAVLSVVSPSDYDRPVAVGKIESPELKESSGLAASECQDVLWTHNDAGNAATVYAMDLTGKDLGSWTVPEAQSIDWESIAGYKDKTGKCYLLIGDIGDNKSERSEIHVYRISEPTIGARNTAEGGAKPNQTAVPERLTITYADGAHNAETLLVHPQTGSIYIITKEKSGPAAVHRVKPEFGAPNPVESEKIGTISVPSSPEGLITGGSFSPDGRRVMLCDVRAGYELVLTNETGDADAIWAQKPVKVNIGDRKQGEGVSYARDGMSLFAASEKKNSPLYQIKRRAAN